MIRGRKHAGGVAGGPFAGAPAGAAAVGTMDRPDWGLYDRVDSQARRRTIATRPGGLDPAHPIADGAAHAPGAGPSPARPYPAGSAVYHGPRMDRGTAYAESVARARRRCGRGVFGSPAFAVRGEGVKTRRGTAGPPGRCARRAQARGAVAHGSTGVVPDALLHRSGAALGEAYTGRVSAGVTVPDVEGIEPAGVARDPARARG